MRDEAMTERQRDTEKGDFMSPLGNNLQFEEYWLNKLLVRLLGEKSERMD